jgi:hypothetical protein
MEEPTAIATQPTYTPCLIGAEFNSTPENGLLAYTDFYFLGSFAKSPDFQDNASSAMVRLNVDNPNEGEGSPFWNIWVIGFDHCGWQKANISIAARLAQVSHLTGIITIIAVFAYDANKSGGRGAEQLVELNFSFDFQQNAYFIELELLNAPIISRPDITYRVSLLTI